MYLYSTYKFAEREKVHLFIYTRTYARSFSETYLYKFCYGYLF